MSRKLITRIADSISAGLISSTRAWSVDTYLKSLRDQSGFGAIQGQSSGYGTVNVYNGTQRELLYRKQSSTQLRKWAEFSPWIRAAVDIYRGTIAQADYRLEPYEDGQRMNKDALKRINKLLDNPSLTRESYKSLKKKWIEDYLVIGHGGIEKTFSRGAYPTSLKTLDAARLWLYPWEGDQKQYRYAWADISNQNIGKYYKDAEIMAIINRKRSYDFLGLSHVESLWQTIEALLNGDADLLEQVTNPIPAGALALDGAGAQQVDETKRQILDVRSSLIVMGGQNASGSKWIPFHGNENEIMLLDKQRWFVAQVAAVFCIPLEVLLQSADGPNSKATTDALVSNGQEGLGALLSEIMEIENADIIAAFGDPSEIGIRLTYPVLNRRDAKVQTEISKSRLGSIPFTTINEERKANGIERMDNDAADEILIATPTGLFTLGMVEKMAESGVVTPGIGAKPTGQPSSNTTEELPNESNNSQKEPNKGK